MRLKGGRWPEERTVIDGFPLAAHRQLHIKSLDGSLAFRQRDSILSNLYSCRALREYLMSLVMLLLT